MNTRTLITLSILTTICAFSPVVTLAQETNTASPSSEAVTQTLKDRVQKVLQNGEGKVEGSSTTQKSTFGLVGNLQKVVGSTLQIATIPGPTRIVEIDRGATFLRAGKPIKLEDVELNSPVTATGVFDQDGTYHVRRLTALNDALTQTPRTTIYGTIQAMTSKAFTLSVIAGTTNAPQWVLPYTSKTAYYDLLDTKIEKKYIKVNQTVVAVVDGELTATSSALRLYVTTPVSTVSATPIQ